MILYHRKIQSQEPKRIFPRQRKKSPAEAGDRIAYDKEKAYFASAAKAASFLAWSMALTWRIILFLKIQ